MWYAQYGLHFADCQNQTVCTEFYSNASFTKIGESKNSVSPLRIRVNVGVFDRVLASAVDCGVQCDTQCAVVSTVGVYVLLAFLIS